MEDRTKNKGFTLMEVVITLAIIAILAAIISPLVINNLKKAKISKAAVDVKEIGNAIISMKNDLAMLPTKNVTNTNMQLLYGPGVIPLPQASTTWQGKPGISLKYHLIDNSNNYLRGPSKEGYPCWNGPYLSKLTADPWDNAYLVNILNLWNGSNLQVHVLSAGENKNTNTNFEGGLPSSDDIGFRIQ